MYADYVYVGEMIRSIREDTTPEQFKTMTSNLRGYTLASKDGMERTALNGAAIAGNIPLIQHIVKEGGKELLSNVCSWGQIPLMNAGIEKKIQAMQELINLGADVNATGVGFERRSSVLEHAVKVIKDLDVIKLLLKNGAINEGWQSYTEEEKDLLNKAKVEIENEKMAKERKKIFLIGAFKDSESEIHKLPRDLQKIIYKQL